MRPSECRAELFLASTKTGGDGYHTLVRVIYFVSARSVAASIRPLLHANPDADVVLVVDLALQYRHSRSSWLKISDEFRSLMTQWDNGRK
ncbi:hypothetical protein BN2476_630066 [Paraburkholderia piptadeniae]|uniref:Uncharacterized protein n=1 Tax=Paraburkholderia piptadeniae TaxID=1701573 RepID=A0A1N7SLQ7_9BURK|nr:hypothetical protein BN2476_630066 [Paraburkholderia piptadeniae]